MRTLVALLPALSGAAVMALAQWYKAGVVLIFLSLPLMFLLWRCPHCGQYLGRNYEAGKYCPHCGGKIE